MLTSYGRTIVVFCVASAAACGPLHDDSSIESPPESRTQQALLPLTALYDPTAKAPKCTTVGSSCDTGPSLVLGRGNFEPMKPNTINSTCADGIGGSFHVDESIDAVMITTLDGSNFAPGKSVRVDAKVFPYSTGSWNFVDVYSASNALSPAWVLIGTVGMAGAGLQTVSKTFTLPNGTLQAVRVAMRYGGSASSCTTGFYDDRDDVIFAVGGSPIDAGSPATPDAGNAGPVDAGVNDAGVSSPDAGSYSSLLVGQLFTNRGSHQAQVLPNGKVLVAGGQTIALTPSSLSSAEIFDPATNLWTAAGLLSEARYASASAVLMNGDIVIFGGRGSSGASWSIDRYSATSNSWASSSGLFTARDKMSATLLANGKVLLAGGVGGSTYAPLSSAEIYDPATGVTSPTGAMAATRYSHQAVRFNDGRVGVFGGAAGAVGTASIEIFNPTTGTWSSGGSMLAGRVNHSVTMLPNGTVLIAGGSTSISSQLSATELYNPVTMTTASGPAMPTARLGHVAVLSGTDVLLFGGSSGGLMVAPVYRFNTLTSTWSIETPLNDGGRSSHTATLLLDGSVLVVGGNLTASKSTERYTKGPQTPVCIPATCTSVGASFCGTVANGCGGTLTCSCAAGLVCSANSCQPAGGTSCAHSVCVTGTKLTSTCSSCAATVCAVDSYCCNSSWDSICAGEAKSMCGSTCP